MHHQVYYAPPSSSSCRHRLLASSHGRCLRPTIWGPEELVQNIGILLNEPSGGIVT